MNQPSGGIYGTSECLARSCIGSTAQVISLWGVAEHLVGFPPNKVDYLSQVDLTSVELKQLL